MIKNTKQSRNRRELFNLIKDIYGKLIANIILNDGRLNAFLLKSGTEEGCLLSPLSIFIEKSFQLNKEIKIIEACKLERNK